MNNFISHVSFSFSSNSDVPLKAQKLAPPATKSDSKNNVFKAVSSYGDLRLSVVYFIHLLINLFMFCRLIKFNFYILDMLTIFLCGVIYTLKLSSNSIYQ